MSALGNSPPVEGCQALLDGVVVGVSALSNSPPVEGWQALLDGVVVACLHLAIPLPVEGWQALLDGVVVACLHLAIPLQWRGGKLCLTGWLWRVCTWQFSSCEGEMSSTDTLGQLHRVCTRRRSLTGWCLAYPPSLHKSTPTTQTTVL